MSFFKKLKDKLFKSSSKLEEGLEAIVAEGAEEEAPFRPDSAGEAQAETPADLDEGPAIADAPTERAPAPVTPTVAEPPAPIAPPEPKPQPSPVVAPKAPAEAAPRTTAPSAPAPTEGDKPAKPGLIGRLFGRTPETAEPRRVLDDAMLESLEELLIQSDMGVDTALRVAANLAEGRMGRKLSVSEIKGLLAAEIARIMEPVARPLPLYPTKPQVVLVVGVNGSGKTTTIGKLASQFRAAGKKVVIAAGDTFRAAAVEQLQVWGERAGVPVMTAPEGSDPASLAFDAMTRASEEGADLLLIDTAGRLQNRQDLMEELA
ncbi:MAG: AAA family ATPase, partial [Rhodobacteraceae bacterium]|nr:AAA family ATPase [Paracoccaceae bacterium]